MDKRYNRTKRACYTANTGMSIITNLSADPLGMKQGMLAGSLFPFAAIFVYSRMRRIPQK